MQKKLTIKLDSAVYDVLHKTIGLRKINKFIQELVHPHVVYPNLDSAYAEMARGRKREKAAIEWAEVTFKEMGH